MDDYMLGLIVGSVTALAGFLFGVISVYLGLKLKERP